MRKIMQLLSVSFLCLLACNSSDKKPAPESDLNAATNFIQAALLGDFDKARIYMIKDSINDQWMSQIKRIPRSPEEKKGLAGASIKIIEVKKINDTATVVIYANSFRNNPDTLRVLKKGGEWLVDFDYLFTHDRDSIWAAPLLLNDSIAK